MKVLINSIKILSLSLIVIIGFIEGQDYNFVDKQNYQIDLFYNNIPGTNLYFFNDNNSTIFMVTVFPELQLNIDFKFYTNNSQLINLIKDERSLFFGFDFNMTNYDIASSGLRSDIFICTFNTRNSTCSDYAYDIIKNSYVLNNDGRIIKNNFIPLGFNYTKSFFFEEDVMDFEYYVNLNTAKFYPENYDNITLFKWINYRASSFKENITAFYGIFHENFNEFSLDETIFNSVAIFTDGFGLLSNSYYYRFNIYVCLILLCFLI